MIRSAERTVDDYADEIEMFEDISGAYAIIGGMAVQIWAARYLDEEALREIGIKPPLTSKDLDIRGRLGHAFAIRGLWTKTTLPLFQEFSWKGSDRKTWAVRESTDKLSRVVGVTELVPGLDTPGKTNGYNLRITHGRINLHVLDPISCLIAKTDVLAREQKANLAGLRRDAEHGFVLHKVVPLYLSELAKRKQTLIDVAQEQARGAVAIEVAEEQLKPFLNKVPGRRHARKQKRPGTPFCKPGFV